MNRNDGMSWIIMMMVKKAGCEHDETIKLIVQLAVITGKREIWLTHSVHLWEDIITWLPQSSVPDRRERSWKLYCPLEERISCDAPWNTCQWSDLFLCPASTLWSRWEVLPRIEMSLDTLLLSVAPRTGPAFLINLFTILVSATFMFQPQKTRA